MFAKDARQVCRLDLKFPQYGCSRTIVLTAQLAVALGQPAAPAGQPRGLLGPAPGVATCACAASSPPVSEKNGKTLVDGGRAVLPVGQARTQESQKVPSSLTSTARISAKRACGQIRNRKRSPVFFDHEQAHLRRGLRAEIVKSPQISADCDQAMIKLQPRRPGNLN